MQHAPSVRRAAAPQSSAGLRCWPSERCSGGCGSWRWGARQGREGCRGGEPSSRRGLLGGCHGEFSAAQGLVFSHADPEIHRDCMTRHTTQERSPARNTSQLWRLQLAVWGSRIRTSLERTGGSTLTPTAPGGGAGAEGLELWRLWPRTRLRGRNGAGLQGVLSDWPSSSLATAQKLEPRPRGKTLAPRRLGPRAVTLGSRPRSEHAAGKAPCAPSALSSAAAPRGARHCNRHPAPAEAEALRR